MGGPGSIPEFLKKPMEERRIEKEPVKEERTIEKAPEPKMELKKMGGPGTYPEPKIRREEPEEKKKEEPKKQVPLETMLKEANEKREAATAAEKEMKKGEEQLRAIEMQVAKQEKEVDSLRRKVKDLDMKARQAEKTVANHPDNKKKEDPAYSEDCERRVRVETEKAYEEGK